MLEDTNSLFAQVDEVLWAEWDPIGINDNEDARDEYSNYVDDIVTMLKGEVSTSELSSHLLSIEKQKMSLEGNRDNCDRVAKILLSLKQ